MKRYNFLIVDDDTTTTAMIEAAILAKHSKWVKKLVVANSYEEARSALEAQKFHVSILDINLGNLTAYDLLDEFETQREKFGIIAFATVANNVRQDSLYHSQPVLLINKKLSFAAYEIELDSFFKVLTRIQQIITECYPLTSLATLEIQQYQDDYINYYVTRAKFEDQPDNNINAAGAICFHKPYQEQADLIPIKESKSEFEDMVDPIHYCSISRFWVVNLKRVESYNPVTRTIRFFGGQLLCLSIDEKISKKEAEFLERWTAFKQA